MSYKRVIPRDLFNEAGLLKCIGRVYLQLEVGENWVPDVVSLQNLGNPNDAFAVEQDPGSGDITLTNVKLLIRGTGYKLWRILNSRASWPLYVYDDDEEIVEVFNEFGRFTAEFRAFLDKASTSG